MRVGILAFAAFVGIGGGVARAALTFSASGVYDPADSPSATLNSGNQADTAAASNNISLAAFQTAIQSAYNNDVGGVIDFENPTGTSDASIAATYGTSQASTLTITRGAFGGGGNIDASTGNNVVISGVRYMGLATNPDFNLTFSQPVTLFGITALARSDGGARNVDLTITLDDSSTVVWQQEAVAGENLDGNSADDTFFGYQAPAGRYITNVQFDNSGFVRFDDLGFAVVPEPASLSMLLLAGFAAVRRRR